MHLKKTQKFIIMESRISHIRTKAECAVKLQSMAILSKTKTSWNKILNTDSQILTGKHRQ